MTPKLEPIIEGNEVGHTLLFVQGWPDDASLWDETVAALRSAYRCVRVTMPNYDGARTERWGHTTEEIVDALVALIDDVSRDDPITLVLHDWGCYWGHAAHHRRPDRVARLVGLDLAPHFVPSLEGSLGIVAYQSWLCGAFYLGGPAGDWMTRRMTQLAGAPRDRREITAWMNYPYRNVWGDLARGRARRMTKGYWPRCPILFVYGERKPFAFHSERWLEHVRSVGGRVVGLPCGHWVMTHPGFVDLLAGWLAETEPSGEASRRGP